MKISLILMAVLFAVVPVLGLSAPSASAELVISYPTTINRGDTIYFNPFLSVTERPSGRISYVSGNYDLYFEFSSGVTYDYLVGQLFVDSSGSSTYDKLIFYFYSSDSSLVGLNLNDVNSDFPDYTFTDSDLGLPLHLLDSYIYNSTSVNRLSNSLSLDTLLFSLDPNDFVPPTEDSFVGVWGETAEFVGDIFIQVGDLFYDDTAEELTPIGTLAVILAGIALVLLVWNLIRSFLPMRG